MTSYELSATAAAVLSQVAASPGRLTPSTIAAVADVPSAAVADAVDELLAAGLVQLLADGHLTTLPTRAPGGDEGSQGRSPALINGLVRLFHDVLDRSTTAPGRPILPAAQHEVLVLLSLGMKDEAIARRLDVSTRTVRRTVSALMADCGAESRFQLAIEAVRLGWLRTDDLTGTTPPTEPQP